jgi:hypothetical protein
VPNLFFFQLFVFLPGHRDHVSALIPEYGANFEPDSTATTNDNDSSIFHAVISLKRLIQTNNGRFFVIL